MRAWRLLEGPRRALFREAFAREIEALRQGDAYRTYERVRDEVLGMKDRQHASVDDGSTPSAYWEEELRNIYYFLDSSPLVVADLRQHTYHVTGIWSYNYRTGKDAARRRHVEQLQALREVGPAELLVPESPILGGFGFDVDGTLVNADTLKFYEVLIALNEAEVLETLVGGDRTVVEVGGGWGGLAYQLKTLYPALRYVIVDLPELFLFSAVYLITAFPQANIAFWHGSGSNPHVLAEADLVFVSHTDYRSLPLDDVRLGINTVSFQEMTTRQVEDYVEWFHDLGTPFLYSLNRDRGVRNTELTSVREIMSRWFWLQGISVLPWPHNFGVTEGAPLGEIARARKREADKMIRGTATDQRDEYRHVVGRPKLLL
jgi:O-methyltransferase domain